MIDAQDQKDNTQLPPLPFSDPSGLFYYPEFIRAQYVMEFAKYVVANGVEQAHFLVNILNILIPLRPDILQSQEFRDFCMSNMRINDDDPSLPVIRLLAELNGKTMRIMAYKNSMNQKGYYRENPRSKYYLEYVNESASIGYLKVFLFLSSMLWIFIKKSNLESVGLAAHHLDTARVSIRNMFIAMSEEQRIEEETSGEEETEDEYGE